MMKWRRFFFPTTSDVIRFVFPPVEQRENVTTARRLDGEFLVHPPLPSPLKRPTGGGRQRALNIYPCVCSVGERDGREQADKRCHTGQSGHERRKKKNGTSTAGAEVERWRQRDEEDERDGCGSSDCGGRRRVKGGGYRGELQKRATHIFSTLRITHNKGVYI